MKILVIDDDHLVRYALSKILLSAGYEVVTASDGRRGMAVLWAEHPDVVITDIIMPDQEGIETIEEVRARFPSLRIMAMSGGFGEAFLNVARKVGADYIIRKPFETGAIREAIRGLLAHPKD